MRTIATAGAAFAALTALVAAHATEPADTEAAQWFRPHDVWGPTQALLVPVIDGLQPARAVVLLVLVSVAASLWRSSWRPMAFAAVVVVGAASSSVVVKFALHRPDPHAQMSALGGSYPSGHVVALLVCLGAAVLVLSGGRARWWQWALVAACCAVMSAALLFTAAHWLSDVVGGAFLGVAVLAGASVLPLGPSRRTAATGETRQHGSCE